MELRRFYVTPEDVTLDVVTVRGNEYRHMTGVLRFKVGYKAIVCDNSGWDMYCTVTAIDWVPSVRSTSQARKNSTATTSRESISLV